MLRWAVIFLIIAIVAALFGFTGSAVGAASFFVCSRRSIRLSPILDRG